MTENWVGRVVQLEVDRVAHGGHCVGRVDGRVVFVRHTLPGETVRARVTEDRGGSFCRADAFEILTPSAGRVTAPCEYAGPGACGGCDFQHVSAPVQRELKAAVVREQLERLAGLDWDVTVEAVEPEPLRWRTRMQYAVHDGGVGLRAHRSSAVIDIDTCLIAQPAADATVATPYADARVTTIEVASGERPPVVQTIDKRRRRRTAAGSDGQLHTVAGRKYRVRPGGFWQVHPASASVLSDAVSQYADARPGEAVLDLYSGVGLFSGRLGEQVGSTGSVLALEGTASAVDDARHNLADLPWVECDRVDIRARSLATRLDETRAAITVLDPPRSGAKPAVCEVVAARTDRVIVYVACDPAAFARDLAAFAEHGWQLSDLRAFDLFPMTHHVECVGRLVRV